MDNIKDILKANGVELDDEKLKAIEKATLENYRTKAETDAKTQKVADLEAQLAKANEALEAAQSADPKKAEEYKKMQEQLQEYKKADEERKAKDAESAAQAEFEEKFQKELGDKKFANSIVAKAIKTAAYEKSKANPDMKLADVLASVTEDADGIWANPQRDPKKMPGANDGGGSGNSPIQSLEDLKGMSVDDIRKHMSEVNKLLEDQQ